MRIQFGIPTVIGSLRPSVVFGCKGILIIFGIFQAYETQRVRLKQVNDSSDNLTEIFNLFLHFEKITSHRLNNLRQCAFERGNPLPSTEF
ncbi:hypothetical protein RRG08_054406 [Elysia crispata]|uniref:Uncharacterized protein n=1 Tax=Elysia crispata TaxID=231223 RepID=A0AAE1DRG5_9GAST|nr:hypothetical protein RRG08_054406 [Elysia crispata]